MPQRSPSTGNDDQPVTPGVGQGGRARTFEELLEAELARNGGAGDHAAGNPVDYAMYVHTKRSELPARACPTFSRNPLPS